ncbi:MAG: SIS domain-containing protein [Dehalococcoidia bacterium]
MAARDLEASEATIIQQLRESAATKERLIPKAQEILRVAQVWAETLRRGNQILFCGNGGSAADAQHLAAELVGRFSRDREAWPARALTTDASVLTALANDFGYEIVFARQVAAYCRPGDIVVGLSTSGESENVIQALREARRRGGLTVAFTGDRGRLREAADYALMVPSSQTPRIQEAHITIGHIICGLVEAMLASD